MDDEPQRYESPTLLRLDRIGEPVPSEKVACTACPVSLWYWKGNDTLTCFCSALHDVTWDDAHDNPNPVQICDGREQALAQLAVQRRAAARSPVSD